MASTTTPIRPSQRHRLVPVAWAALACLASAGAQAVVLADDDTHQVRLDTTVKYSAGWRMEAPSAAAATARNNNDGNLSFHKGDMILNRLDLLGEFDYRIKGKNEMGLRLSAAGWYDQVYNSSHAPVPVAQYNAISVDNTHFTRTAQRMMGRDAEVLDAFAFGTFDLGSVPVSVRVGRHAVIWGESLFLGAYGIAAGNGPSDIIKAVTVPQSTTKELSMPVGQVSASALLGNGYSLQGYYQLEYRQSKFVPPGAYFSTLDFVFQGGERLFAGPAAILHGTDEKPPKSGQWGLALKRSDQASGLDLGLYLLRYTDKLPQSVTTGVGPAARYSFRYPSGVRMLGTSFSLPVGESTLAGDVSLRDNQPLVTRGGQAGFATGRTFQAVVSSATTYPKAALWDALSLSGEVGYQRLLSVQSNAAMRDTTRNKDAAQVVLSVTPTYYQALTNLDVQVPIGLNYYLRGNSPVDPASGTGKHQGSFSVGLTGIYANTWNMQLRFTHYLSPSNASIDRDFLTLSVARAF